MNTKVPTTLEEALKIIAEQQKQLIIVEETIREKDAKIKHLNDLLAAKRAREFCKRTETANVLQLYLFDKEPDIKVEFQSTEETVETEEAKKETKQNKSSKGRKALPKDRLPVMEYHNTLLESERICDKCGSEMKKVRENRSERLVHVKGYEYIEVVITDVYECQNCVKENDSPVTKKAEEKRIIENSITTPELLSYVFNQKFNYHMPYYRLEDAYNFQGIALSRQDMSSWQIKVHSKLKPLENRLMYHLKRGPCLLMDETPLKVLNKDYDQAEREKWKEDKKSSASDNKSINSSMSRTNSYMWVAIGGNTEHPVHMYNFRWTRSGKNAFDFIEDMEGDVLQTDGFSGYVTAVSKYNKEHPESKIVHASCNVHCRRYFADAVKATKSELASQGVKYYKEIYDIERNLRKQYEQKLITDEQFIELRKKEEEKVFDEFYKWLNENKEAAPKSSKTAEAINYALNRWELLKNYMDYPFLTPDTNAALYEHYFYPHKFCKSA